MNKRAQIIRMIILVALLCISLYLLIKVPRTKGAEQIQTQTRTQTTAVLTSSSDITSSSVPETTTIPSTTQTTQTTQETTTAQTEQQTTTSATTATQTKTSDTDVQTTQGTTVQTTTTTTTRASATTTTASTTTTTASTTTTTLPATTQPVQTTTAPTTTKQAVFYGPYVLNDISGYNIINPNNDYTGAGGADNFDLSGIGRGKIKVHFTGEGDYKVRIEKDGAAYNYDLVANGIVEVFPLQLGNGSYKAMILKRIVDTRFSVVSSVSFTVNISDQNFIYINSIQIVHWLPQMTPISYARNTIISDVLTNGKFQKSELALESFRAVWSYILSNIIYDKAKYSNIANMAGYLPSIPATFSEKKGICFDYAAFMAGILRSFGIPVKLVTGYCPTYYGDVYHAWNEVYIDGRWILVDPTYDAAYFQAGKRVDFEKNKSLYTVSRIY